MHQGPIKFKTFFLHAREYAIMAFLTVSPALSTSLTIAFHTSVCGYTLPYFLYTSPTTHSFSDCMVGKAYMWIRLSQKWPGLDSPWCHVRLLTFFSCPFRTRHCNCEQMLRTMSPQSCILPPLLSSSVDGQISSHDHRRARRNVLIRRQQ